MTLSMKMKVKKEILGREVSLEAGNSEDGGEGTGRCLCLVSLLGLLTLFYVLVFPWLDDLLTHHIIYLCTMLIIHC